MTSFAGKSRSSSSVLIAILIVILGIIILRNAWVSDDAYISFRVVDNFVHGHGLTWNITERVQAFTNPLWVLLTSLFYAVSGDVYYTSIFTSLLVTLVAATVMTRKISLSIGSAILSIVLLLFSKAFIDYSTSGLENSLSHLILVVFMAIFFCAKRSSKRLFYLSLVSSLGMLNRLDLALLFIPSLLWACVETDRSSRFTQVVAGLSPLIVWEVFSVIYYGFPVPNTFFAKLCSGIPATELARQSLSYYVDTLSLDPLTLAVIVSGLAVVWLSRQKGGIPFAIGIVLYLFYVVRIGGDFMTGRFFAAPFVVAVGLISRQNISTKGISLLVPLAATLVLGLASPRCPILSDSSYGTIGDFSINPRGIADERGCYYPSTGFLLVARGKSMPDHWWITKGKRLKSAGEKLVADVTIGFRGFAAGPGVHIVDELALADPLLSRLPVPNPHIWRVGHMRRAVPPGYLETLETGVNQIRDTSLAEYYDHLKRIVSGPLWSWERFRSIIGMNLGRYDHLKQTYAGFADVAIRYSDVCTPKPRGTVWDAPGNIILNDAGVVVRLDSVVTCGRIEISLDHNDLYELIYLNGTADVGSTLIKDAIILEQGLRVDTVNIETNGSAGHIDAIRIRPVSGDGRYSVGHLRLLCGDSD